MSKDGRREIRGNVNSGQVRDDGGLEILKSCQIQQKLQKKDQKELLLD